MKGRGTAAEKKDALRKAGVTVVETVDDIGVTVRDVLDAQQKKPDAKSKMEVTA